MGLRPGQAKGPWVGTSGGGGGVTSANAGNGIDITGSVISGRHIDFLGPERWVFTDLDIQADNWHRFSSDTIGFPVQTILTTTEFTGGHLYASLPVPGLWSASPSFQYKAESWYLAATLYSMTDVGLAPTENYGWTLKGVIKDHGDNIDETFATPDFSMAFTDTTGIPGNALLIHRFEETTPITGSDKFLLLQLNTLNINPDVSTVMMMGVRFEFLSTPLIP